MALPSRYKALQDELSKWDVGYSFEPTRNHAKVTISNGHAKRVVIVSSSTSDQRALKNQISDIRKAMAALGAMRHER